jgi:dihydroorotase
LKLTSPSLIVKNGIVVTPEATFAADLAISEGRFSAIAVLGGVATLERQADEVLDATGLHVLPGVIDPHVHFREPGLEHKEDLASGSLAAVMGGVTTVIDMPNTVPPTATAEAVRQKRELVETKSYCDVRIIGAFTQDNLDELLPMSDAGVVGYKVFLGETTGGLAAPDDGTLLEGMSLIAATGKRIAFHAENDEIIRHASARLRAAGRTDARAHLESRPALAEVEAIQRACLFALHTGARIHILHVSSAQGLAMIETWRGRGVDVTCELTAHHAFLTSEPMHRLGARLRVNPPVREPGHGDILLEALASGRIDAIASDHAPHTPEEKLHDDIWRSVSGFAGVEISVPLFLTAVHAGRLSLNTFVRATSRAPAQIWGLHPQKGEIRIGSDGDLTIVDLERRGVIRAAELHGKNNLTPFETAATVGGPVAAVVRGRVVARDGELTGADRGRMAGPHVHS